MSERELENHEVRLTMLEKDIVDLGKKIDELNKNMVSLTLVLEQGKGGWKVIAALGTIVAFLATVLSRVLDGLFK